MFYCLHCSYQFHFVQKISFWLIFLYNVTVIFLREGERTSLKMSILFAFCTNHTFLINLTQDSRTRPTWRLGTSQRGWSCRCQSFYFMKVWDFTYQIQLLNSNLKCFRQKQFVPLLLNIFKGSVRPRIFKYKVSLKWTHYPKQHTHTHTYIYIYI